VQSPGAGLIDAVGGVAGGVLIAAATPDALIAAAAKRPTTVFGDGPLPVSSTTPISGDIRA
jgi:hypothetical protein